MNSSAVRFYEYPMKQFTVSNINRDACSIWITFDESIADMVLGLDIVKDMIFLNNPGDGEMHFFESASDCKKYIQII